MEHVFVPLVKLAGALTPAGKPKVVVIGPVVGPAVIAFVTVIGTLLGAPAFSVGDGWPTRLVKSGGAAATAVFGVMFGAALLPGLLSPGVVVVPVNVGVVPTVVLSAVTGICIVVLMPAPNGPGLTQVTV